VKNNVVSVDFSNTKKPVVNTPAPAPAKREWSSQQAAIFDWGKASRGNLVVRARAGTGKTTTIIAMLEFMKERQILLAAFNKSIARELQGRITKAGVQALTLHGLGLKYIRRNWTTVKVEDRDVKVRRSEILAARACRMYAEKFLSGAQVSDDVVRLVRDLHTKCRELIPLTQSWEDIEDIAARFDLMPDEEWQAEGWTSQAVCMTAYRAMSLAKERTDVIDFADMIYLPLVHSWVRPWFDAVIVDEAQDMTEAQLMIAQGACRRSGRIIIVGDDRQAIYAFRGADSGSLDRLKTELKATELGLTVTYRCATSIVSLAQKLVPDYVAAPNAIEGIVDRCDREDLIEFAKEGDFVLSRTNAPLVKVCMALLKRGTRAVVKGRDIGKGIVSLLKKLKARTVADVPAKLEAYVAREKVSAANLADDAKQARIEFLDDQQAIVLALLEGAATLKDVENRAMDLFTDDPEKATVVCSSVHKAKGLETNRAFLLEGTFRVGGEEDNIRYVAITRAKHHMTWVAGYDKKAA
jgi:DNA helicase-2/ATP-dependent DNA helicase PcrA